MTSEEINEEVIEQKEPAPTGPGELLAKKREELGIDIQQVADKLHITMHYVRALEENAHDKLPGDIFVRGYIRSYANFLKLDADVLINVYHEYASLQQCAEQKAQKTKLRRRRDKNLPWVIVSGVAFIVVAIVLWYFNSGEEPAAPSTTTQLGQAAQTQTLAAAIVREAGTPEQPQVSFSAHPVVETSLDAANDITAPTLPTEQDVEAAEHTMAQELIVSDIEEPDVNSEAELSVSAAPMPEQAVETPASVPPSTPVQALAVGQVITVDAGGEDVLKITFSGESIVQIDDSSDTQIYRDIRIAGDVLEVMGSAPFNILLGDAASTALTFNGSAVDFRTNIRVDNSARLTIGL